MSESKELVLVSLPAAPADLEAAFIDDQYISNLITEIRAKASSVVGDVKTVKGRGVYISMASNVRKTKTAIDDAGKALEAEMKKRPALVDASRKKVREALDALAIEIRKPATEWEVEQERVKAEEEFNAKHVEALEINEAFDKAAVERFESDHETALLMNEIFDREIAEKQAEAERQRIVHEEELKRQAEEKVKHELEEKQQRERDESTRRETELKLKAETAVRQRLEDAAQAERNRIAAEQKVIADKIVAEEKAEREKQEAIEAERRKATEAEQARQAEKKRIADELAKRTADVEHQRNVNRAAFDGLVKAGIPDDWARECIKAITLGKIPNATINY